MSTERNNIQPVRFFHRGKIVEVSGVHPTRSVLDWLREDAHCTGTKEGCNEGDCGACTVVIGELASGADASGAVGGLQLQTVNACIQFLPTLHGKALFTVEDLKDQCPANAPAATEVQAEATTSKRLPWNRMAGSILTGRPEACPTVTVLAFRRGAAG